MSGWLIALIAVVAFFAVGGIACAIGTSRMNAAKNHPVAVVEYREQNGKIQL